MPATIDLRKAHLHRQHGDLLAVYTWINSERALVLLPAFRTKSPWFVLMESAAYQYDDPAYLARMCKTAAEVMGMEPSKNNWVRIGTIIHEGLPDLYRMPTEPSWERGPDFGEMVIKLDGKEVASEKLTADDVGVTYA